MLNRSNEVSRQITGEARRVVCIVRRVHHHQRLGNLAEVVSLRQEVPEVLV